MVIARVLTVVGEPPHTLHQREIVASHRAAVAEAAQVLGGVEAPGGQPSQPAHPAPPVERAMGLRRILDQPQPVAVAQPQHAVDVERPAVEVDADDAARARGDTRRGVGGIEVEGGSVDVAEDRHAAGEEHGLGGGEEAEGGDDHLVADAGADAESAQGKDQRVGAVGDAHAGLDPEKAGELALELSHFRTEDEGARLEDALPALLERRCDPAPGAAEIEIGDLQGRGHGPPLYRRLGER